MQQDMKKVDLVGRKAVMIGLHPNWHEFIKRCEDLGFGEIYRIKIQDGLPMTAEIIKKNIRFSKNHNGTAS